MEKQQKTYKLREGESIILFPLTLGGTNHRLTLEGNQLTLYYEEFVIGSEKSC